MLLETLAWGQARWLKQLDRRNVWCLQTVLLKACIVFHEERNLQDMSNRINCFVL